MSSLLPDWVPQEFVDGLPVHYSKEVGPEWGIQIRTGIHFQIPYCFIPSPMSGILLVQDTKGIISGVLRHNPVEVAAYLWDCPELHPLRTCVFWGNVLVTFGRSLHKLLQREQQAQIARGDVDLRDIYVETMYHLTKKVCQTVWLSDAAHAGLLFYG